MSSPGEPARDAQHGDEAIIVFAGPLPETGSIAGTPVWWTGTVQSRDRLIGEPPSPTDRRFPMQSENGPGWVLLTSDRTDTRQILVIEDNPQNRSYYLAVLTEQGLEATGVGTGAHAIDMIRSRPFDLAIVDVRLPDANGFELCRALLEEPLLGDAGALLMSADRVLADSPRAAAAGASGFLTNPASPHEIIEAVRAVLHLSADAPGDYGIRRPDVTLQLFATPTVAAVNGSVLQLPRGRMTEILATLAAACPASVSAERLAELVWGRSTDDELGPVYTSMSRLRSMLRDQGFDDLVVRDEIGYSLQMEPGNIDLGRFERRSRAILTRPDDHDAADAETVLGDWQGEPFSETKNAVLRRWRARIVESRAQMLEFLALSHLRSQEPRRAAVAAEELLDDEPWRESVWGLLTVARYREGRANDALLALQSATRRMREELGLEPGPALSELELKVLSHDPDLLDDLAIDQFVRGGTMSRRRDPFPQSGA